MTCIDIFNGDADGLCALQQLRLAEPRDAVLITGVKRDIDLIAHVHARPGDRLTVLDISLDANRRELERVLAHGAQVRYVDHHYAGEIPVHPALEAYIDTAADICTSAIVDRLLAGRFRRWAVVAAYGDNLPALGDRLAAACGIAEEQRAVLAHLGRCLNYNAYGESVRDLRFHPCELFRLMQPFADPIEFAYGTDAYAELTAGYEDDMHHAAALQPERESDAASLMVLPDAPWARRVCGVLANDLAQAEPLRAHAILSPNNRGGFTVSVRAPVARPEGADDLCRQFDTGGGRRGAAGINHLPASELGTFASRFETHFRRH